MKRLWDKGLPLDEKILKYTAGEDHILDHRLVSYDIKASIAHVEMLASCKLLEANDSKLIIKGLIGLLKDYQDQKWSIHLEDEDVHTAIEKNLIEKIGEVGGRIHLGRSRNDQVLTALRLYYLDAIDEIIQSTEKLCREIRALDGRQGSVKIPGTTHMQHAMPSSVSLWCGAYVEAFEDDIEGMIQAKRRSNKNPLGSAAGYGTPGLPINRNITTKKLGFEVTQEPVTAPQLSRGKAESHLLFELSLLMHDLGRLSSDLLLYYTQEYRYIDLPTEVTTGSSIMPQKRNPDVLELIRASSATVLSCLNESMMVMAKLPSGFQRDLQKIKAPLFKAIDNTVESVDIMSYVISTMKFLPQNIDLGEDLFAAEKAYKLVLSKGISFRKAYQQISKKYKK